MVLARRPSKCLEMNDLSELLAYSLQAGERVLARRHQRQRKELGQFLTPLAVARYMACQLGPLRDGDRILDPAIGSGILACAVIEQAAASGEPLELHIDGYEVDPELAQTARDVLAQATEMAARSGVTLHTHVYERDFVLARRPLGPLFDVPDVSTFYDHIIANPPYFKLSKDDPRVQAVEGRVNGYTNIYTLFMALSLKLLRPLKRACFIVPRSFCSGAYFSAFRRDFMRQAAPIAIHLFESREEVFKRSDVLQENIVLTFHARQCQEEHRERPGHVFISTSRNAVDLDANPAGRKVPLKLFLGKRNGITFFRLPTSEVEESIVEAVDRWEGSLQQYGLAVSTGPVVAFRARAFLSTDVGAVESGQAVPLLWMQNVQAQAVDWPVVRGNKPQAILLAANDKKLLVPLRNYVLLRRFSAKEEHRRLVAAPLLAGNFESRCQQIGLENHLNYVYREVGDLTAVEAVGLSALLNSVLVDRYFRVTNGNTQVNATDLRALPLPPLGVIERIGQAVMAASSSADVDQVTLSILRDTGFIPKRLESVGGIEDDGKNRGSAGRFADPGIATSAAERDISSHSTGARTVIGEYTME
jgi:adenine-specific DNA-methyltransferase